MVRRAIHATVDFSYAKELRFHPQAIEVAVRAIQAGNNIVADVGMVKAGISVPHCEKFGIKVLCFIDEPEVKKIALKEGCTRAIASMRYGIKEIDGAIVAIGNAPTALDELCNLIRKNKVKPALVIGIPIGFVGAKESKIKLMKLNVPYIANKSEKGGSTIAVAIVNALLRIAEQRNGKAN